MISPSPTFKATAPNSGIWTPGQRDSFSAEDLQRQPSLDQDRNEEPIAPVWTPKSAGSSPQLERKEFRPISFNSPVLSRKNQPISPPQSSSQIEPPWRHSSRDFGQSLSSSLQKRIPNSHSAPSSGFSELSQTPRLPRAQNPTIILLQKAREGQLPKGASYIEEPPLPPRKHESPPKINPGEIVYEIKNEYTSESESERPKRIADLGPRKFPGIGPTTKEGMPLTLRSEVRDQNQSKWYKKMYDTIHKQKPRYDGRYPYTSGYVSEPEPGAYDSDSGFYHPGTSTLDRRRPQDHPDDTFIATYTMPRTIGHSYSLQSDVIKHGKDVYKNQPGRIENYIPGHSSISEKEAKEWWDEVMDIFDGHLEQQKHIPSKGYMSQALKESGYESDSTLVFRRREDALNQLSPSQQKEAYRTIQRGGDVPLHGLRKPAPERPKEIEYIPISPTLTKIRVHKNRSYREEFAYPNENLFKTYKRSAPSCISNLPPIPPSPPKRKSSRNNSTLRLISTMQVNKPKETGKRHETCFITTSNLNKNSNVKYLRDKITCKLSPSLKKKGETKIKVTKTVCASPESKISSTLSTTKDVKSSINKVYSRTSLNDPKKVSTIKKSCCKQNQKRSSSLDRSPEKRLLKSPELLSPNEVKKAGDVIQKQRMKKNEEKITKKIDLPIKVTISERGRELLRSNSTIPSSSKSIKSRKTCISPAFSMSSSKKSSTSMESLKSTKKVPIKSTTREIKEIKNPKLKKTTTTTKPKDQSTLKKSKKDQLNGEIKLVKKENSPITLEDIKKQKKSVETDSFFQHLFLRNQPIQKSETFSNTSSWIVEKTKALERRSSNVSEPSIGALKIYLNNRKPVSDSKFKQIDAIRSRSASPKSVRFENFDPKRSFYQERSISLPPKLTIIRPKSPSRLVFDAPIRKVPEKIIFSDTSRPITPPLESRIRIRSRSSSPQPDTIYFSQTKRPISPSPYSSNQSLRSEIRSDVRSESFRSPSYKRIHGNTSLEFIKRKLPRSRSAGAAENYQKLDFNQNLTQSTSSIESFCSKKEYQDYVKDLIQSKRKSERFKELNKFYSTIERLGELEKTTSSSDLRPRRKYEDEIIDYDRWKEVRLRERTEREINNIYKELKDVQKERDLLFLPKDVNKWKNYYDSGLRIKEKSVDNIKEDFEKLNFKESDKFLELQMNKDVYKPLWRGNSVVNLAQMTEKRDDSKIRQRMLENKKMIETDRLLTRGVGSRIWSSLSMEQVNTLKNQLKEIYQNGQTYQKNIEPSIKTEHFVEVPTKKLINNSNLTVRRNSESSKIDQTKFNEETESLSEIDKKKLSQSLSQEILERQRQKYKSSISLVLAKETFGAIASAEAKIKAPPPSPRTCYSLEMSEDGDYKKQKDEDFFIVVPKNENWVEPKKALIKTNVIDQPTKKTSSNSETESTDDSTRTVLCADTKAVKKKVEYFEHVHEKDEFMPTIYKPADDEEMKEENNNVLIRNDLIRNDLIRNELIKNKKKDDILSKSCQDFKELFGEIESAKLASSPISRTSSRTTNTRSRPSSGCSKTSENFQSESRNISPNPELYYLSLAKSGDVKKLKTKFDSIRRCNSDSEIHKSFKQIIVPGLKLGEVDNLRRKYEYPHLAGRGRSRIRRGGVVSPICLKAEDRYMPHINIISKIAALYPKKSTLEKEKEKSVEELAEILGLSVGEVEKMRQKFDSPDRMSLLGHMFTSSPNLNELKDIAPYLTASWAAHKFPKQEDNTLLLSSLDHENNVKESKDKSMDTDLVKKVKKNKKGKEGVALSSILKDGKSNQLQRSPSGSPTTSSSSRYCNKSWWMGSPTKSTSVTFFEEPDAPIPPPKTSRRKVEYQESPRKYVENEVTIHYKTPVRQEVKESVSEDELQRRQAEHMKKVYQEERRRKYLQVSQSVDHIDELQDMNSRRHTDNFIPSQKSPIPLNRYDDFIDDYSPKLKPRPKSPEPRLVAKALYTFVGQTARELTFKKGDIIYIRRQIDKNWYEGEHNAMVGLFPANYVEIIPYDGLKSTTRKSHEGQARAKYNFIAQTHLELSLAKGELVVITRRVDDNWFEGKIGGRKGIFPVSYVEVLIDPSEPPQVPVQSKPVAAPAAHSLLLNGSLGGKESMGAHNYVPASQNTHQNGHHNGGSTYHAKPVHITGSFKRNPLNQELHVDTQSEPYVPYRALYKYKPQNEDEIELNEGDTVYVLEKCDDGWFVGASDRTGALGTFPGNYVERI